MLTQNIQVLLFPPLVKPYTTKSTCMYFYHALQRMVIQNIHLFPPMAKKYISDLVSPNT